MWEIFKPQINIKQLLELSTYEDKTCIKDNFYIFYQFRDRLNNTIDMFDGNNKVYGVIIENGFIKYELAGKRNYELDSDLVRYINKKAKESISCSKSQRKIMDDVEYRTWSEGCRDFMKKRSDTKC